VASSIEDIGLTHSRGWTHSAWRAGATGVYEDVDTTASTSHDHVLVADRDPVDVDVDVNDYGGLGM